MLPTCDPLGWSQRETARRLGMRLAFWRTLFSVAVDAHDLFPRLVPPLVVQWAEDKFYDAGMRQTLRRATADYREATADTIPAPAEAWDCLVGGPELSADAGEEHAATVDLHGEDFWPSSRQRREWVA